jgi:hypothetical protein
MLIVGIASVLALMPSQLSSQQSTAVRVDNDDIGGVVAGANRPEAGVWVIAETTDLPTKYAKIVLSDLGLHPAGFAKANYSVWVGVMDSSIRQG